MNDQIEIVETVVESTTESSLNIPAIAVGVAGVAAVNAAGVFGYRFWKNRKCAKVMAAYCAATGGTAKPPKAV